MQNDSKQPKETSKQQNDQPMGKPVIGGDPYSHKSIRISKKALLIGGIVVVVLALAGGAFALLKSKNNKDNNVASTSSSTSTDNTSTTTTSSDNFNFTPIDATKLPLGDQHYGSTAKVGYIYSCESSLNGGGADKDGPWINSANGTWDSTAKNVVVDGSNTWSNAKFTVTESGDSRVITGNALPTNAGTGNFPISASDDAYSYDHNPNTVSAHDFTVSLPLNPTVGSTPHCSSLSVAAYGVNGVAIFNGLDGGGRDAVAHEIQDSCEGHPEMDGVYHYHSFTKCLLGTDTVTTPTLVGYALDGFGLYKYPTDPQNSDLDECHGRTASVMWNGKVQSIYHYVVTKEFPYTIGCFKGTPVDVPSSLLGSGSNSSSLPPKKQ